MSATGEPLRQARDRERGLLLSDRLNPLFVRDLQQSFAGRGFVAALFLALLAMMVVASIALDFEGEARGPRALGIVLFALGLMVDVVVPLQAFQATRQEMHGGTSDQLLLSSLTPAAIVRGKLLAAALKILLWTSLFSPLVALTWLLRGLSVAQVGIALVVAIASGLVVSAVGVVLGTLTVFRRVATLVNVGAALMLTGGGFGMALGLSGMTFAWTRFGGGLGDLLAVLFALLVSTVVLMALCILVAQSQFTHPHENRSTGFRLFLPVATLLIWGLGIALADKGDWDEALLGSTLFLLAVGSIFFLFAATEERRLSPRVRMQVPQSPGAAMWVSLLLPGGGRGLLWCMAMVILLALGPELLAAVLKVKLDAGLTSAVEITAVYAVLYAALGTFVRQRLPAGPSGSWWARLIVIGVVVLGSVASSLMLAMAPGFPQWNPLQIVNPVWTIVAYADGKADSAMMCIVVPLAFLLLGCAGTLAEGVSEVTQASTERRPHAA
ncbi:MAG TPA: hypothetical protein VFY71_14855 [Planctomycetota bacterium]|nr:hypothetical protein [Planctomycetota bacterium]